MPDKPGTGAPGLFQKAGGARREEEPVLVATTAEQQLVQQSAVSLLGLITRLQNVEAQLSLLRREKILAVGATEEAVRLSDEESQKEFDELKTQLDSAERQNAIAQGITRTTIAFVEETAFFNTPGTSIPVGTNIVGVGSDLERGRRFIAGLLARLNSSLP